MKLLIIVLALMFSTHTNAEWYEDHKADWWVVVYSKMQCSKAKEYGKEIDPVNLINNHECIYETENSIKNKMLSIGCEKKLKTGFIFSPDKENCILALESIKEYMESNQESD